MSLNPFHGKTVVSVQVATQPLHTEVPEDRLTTIITNTILGSAKNDLLGAILYANLAGYKAQLLAYANYGASSYTYGLPVTNLSNNEVNAIEVKAVLDVILSPDTVTINRSFLFEPTNFVWAQWWLYENEVNYNFTDNTLLQDAITWDVVGATRVGNNITVQLDDGGTPGTYATTITDMPAADIYYEVEYIINGAPTVDHIWLYQPSLGTHATLDVTNSFVTNNVFPIVPIRIDDVNVNADKESDEYKTTKQLLNIVHIDLNDITTGVTKQPDEDGNLTIDIANLNLISDIFYLYAINIYGQTQIEKQTLYNLFVNLEGQSRLTKTQHDAQLLTNLGLSDNTFSINSTTFNYEVTFSYITITNIAGHVLDRGTYSVSYTAQTNAIHTRDTGDDQRIIRGSITIRYQSTETEYTEIFVKGLYILQEVQSVKGLRTVEIFIEAYTPGADLTDNQRNFIIPLTTSEINLLTPREADQLVPLITHIMIYASDSQKLKWYQTGAFKALIQFVLYVFAAISLFGDPSGTTASQLISLAVLIAIKYAFEWVLSKLLIKYSDNKIAEIIIQIVAVVVIILFLGDLTEFTAVEKALLIVNAVTQVVSLKAMVDLDLLAIEQLAFEADFEAAEAELEAATKFLEIGNVIDPGALIDTRNYKYEEPNDFFARTLTINPGILGFDHLHNYVDISLNLEYIQI